MKKLLIILVLTFSSFDIFCQLYDTIIDKPYHIVLYGSNDTTIAKKIDCSIDQHGNYLYLIMNQSGYVKKVILNADTLGYSNNQNLRNDLEDMLSPEFSEYKLLYSTDGSNNIDTTWYRRKSIGVTSFLELKYYTTTVFDSSEWKQYNE